MIVNEQGKAPRLSEWPRCVRVRAHVYLCVSEAFKGILETDLGKFLLSQWRATRKPQDVTLGPGVIDLKVLKDPPAFPVC